MTSYSQMTHPNLDATIQVAEVGIPIHQQAGWVLAGDDTASPDTSASTGDATTSEAATPPATDGGQPATTETGTAAEPDTTTEGTPA